MADRLSREYPHSRFPAKWLVAIALAIVAAVGLVELISSVSVARAQMSDRIEQRGNVLAVPAQISRDSWGLYLIDTDNTTMCVYQYQPMTRKLRLLASRNYSYDLQLDEYNTQPLPAEIKDLLQQQRRFEPPTTGPAGRVGSGSGS